MISVENVSERPFNQVNNNDTADSLKQEELALAGLLSFESYADELNHLSANLPADPEIRKALKKEIEEGKLILEKHNKQSKNNNPTTFDKLLSKALSIVFKQDDFRPEKPLIDHQIKLHNQNHEAAMGMLKARHQLILANTEFDNYIHAKGYDINKINRAIKKGDTDCEALDSFMKDPNVLSHMDNQKKAADELINVTNSDATKKLHDDITNGTIAGDFSGQLKNQATEIGKLEEKISETPIIDDGVKKNMKEKLDELMKSLASIFDNLFNKPRTP